LGAYCNNCSALTPPPPTSTHPRIPGKSRDAFQGILVCLDLERPLVDALAKALQVQNIIHPSSLCSYIPMMVKQVRAAGSRATCACRRHAWPIRPRHLPLCKSHQLTPPACCAPLLPHLAPDFRCCNPPQGTLVSVSQGDTWPHQARAFFSTAAARHTFLVARAPGLGAGDPCASPKSQGAAKRQQGMLNSKRKVSRSVSGLPHTAPRCGYG
jgi:hypothetical protein